MKRFLIILLIIINTTFLTIFIFSYKEYNIKNNILNVKLSGVTYKETISELENKKTEIINEIENTLNYEFEDDSTFEDIKSDLNNKHQKLLLENKELESKKNKLTEQKNTLNNTYNKILEEERKKKTFIITGVPKINQYKQGYPTGCESAALTSLLKYWGVNVSMSQVVNKLPKGKLPYYENGKKYGGNPYLEFVGNPKTSSSYGVYEKPIIQVANEFKPGIINGTGMSLSSVLNIVKQERPVLVWVSMYMAVPYIGNTWTYKPTGEKIKWMSNEHALVVIGYTDSQVVVTDSLNGQVRYYSRKVFENRYNTYGKRALYY